MMRVEYLDLSGGSFSTGYISAPLAASPESPQWVNVRRGWINLRLYPGPVGTKAPLPEQAAAAEAAQQAAEAPHPFEAEVNLAGGLFFFGLFLAVVFGG